MGFACLRVGLIKKRFPQLYRNSVFLATLFKDVSISVEVSFGYSLIFFGNEVVQDCASYQAEKKKGEGL